MKLEFYSIHKFMHTNMYCTDLALRFLFLNQEFRSTKNCRQWFSRCVEALQGNVIFSTTSHPCNFTVSYYCIFCRYMAAVQACHIEACHIQLSLH